MWLPRSNSRRAFHRGGVDKLDRADRSKQTVFPFFGATNIHENAAAKLLTRYLKSAAKLDSTKEIPDDLCGTGLRNGATTTMYAAGLDVATVSVRGGWTLSGSNSGEYFICESFHVARGGKVLAGWQKDDKCLPPKMDIIFNSLTEAKRNDFRRFIQYTFCYAANMPSTLPEVLCATLLSNLKSFISSYGSDHVVVKTLFAKANRYGISDSKLRDYGERIQDDFATRNMSIDLSTRDYDINSAMLGDRCDAKNYPRPD